MWSYCIVVRVKGNNNNNKNLPTAAQFKTEAEESVTTVKWLSLRKTGFALHIFTWKMK